MEHSRKKLIISFLIIFIFWFIIFWISYQLITPLIFGVEVGDSLLFSLDSFVPVVVFTANGFFLELLYLGVLAIRDKFNYKNRVVRKLKYYPMLIFGVIGLTVNYANYFLVIKPNGLLQCSDKMGYKQNLMHDYVHDLTYCERK